MDAVKSVKAIAQVHLTGSRIPDAGRQHRTFAILVRNPAQHHDVCIEYLLRLPSFATQALREMNLACHTIASHRIGNTIADKDEAGLRLRAPHLQAVVRLALSRDAPDLQISHFKRRQSVPFGLQLWRFKEIRK